MTLNEMGDERYMAADWCGMPHLTLMKGSQGSVVYMQSDLDAMQAPLCPPIKLSSSLHKLQPEKKAETTQILMQLNKRLYDCTK